jgi:hypothetical protein
MYVTQAMGEALMGAAATDRAGGTRGAREAIKFDEVRAPGNVVAIIPGVIKAQGQFVAIGAHNDHTGFTLTPVDHDSVRASTRSFDPREDDPSATRRPKNG